MKANDDSSRTVLRASPESVPKVLHRGVSESDTMYLFPIGMRRTDERAHRQIVTCTGCAESIDLGTEIVPRAGHHHASPVAHLEELDTIPVIAEI